MELDTDSRDQRVTTQKEDKLDKAFFRAALLESLRFASAYAGVFLVIAMTIMISQIIAVGLLAAWDKYNKLWLFLIIGGTGLGVVISSILNIGFPLAELIMKKVVPQKNRLKVEKLIGVVLAVGMTLFVLFQIGSLGYQDAKEAHHKFPELDSDETAAVGEAVNNQSQSLNELAKRATEVLNQLTATEQTDPR